MMSRPGPLPLSGEDVKLLVGVEQLAVRARSLIFDQSERAQENRGQHETYNNFILYKYKIASYF